MNDNYLWDKTGSDVEIEHLENTLSAFRCQKTAAPMLPAKVIPFKKESPCRSSFRFAYAVAACAAFVMIGLGVWFQILSNQTVDQIDLVETITPPINEPIQTAPIVKKAEPSPEAKIKTPKQITVRKIVKTNKIVQPIVYQKEKKAGNHEPKKPEVRLTKEEQYAYNQLMLALSITSSKLKMVKDKVEGFEE